jgi:hypothetical protein
MLNPAAVLALGGLFNLWVAALVGWRKYRLQERRAVPVGKSGATANDTALWNGFLLLTLSTAISHTAFTGQVNLQLALIQVFATLLSTGRAIYAFWKRYDDLFVLRSQFLMRFLGLGHILDLLVTAGILYGVVRGLGIQ